ncbi:MAG: hypothetical protein LBT10_02285 [Methanobrevibacter sp.]|nr:hypothetical protein [Methanobrevibacter sp.]
MSHEITEDETRTQFIDPLLKSVGWNKKYIKEEVNSVKSDFKNNDLVLFKEYIEKGVDRFIDYLLLDENNNPLSIIEAKRCSKNWHCKKRMEIFKDGNFHFHLNGILQIIMKLF